MKLGNVNVKDVPTTVSLVISLEGRILHARARGRHDQADSAEPAVRARGDGWLDVIIVTDLIS
jgi:hypothetical protein